MAMVNEGEADPGAGISGGEASESSVGDGTILSMGTFGPETDAGEEIEEKPAAKPGTEGKRPRGNRAGWKIQQKRRREEWDRGGYGSDRSGNWRSWKRDRSGYDRGGYDRGGGGGYDRVRRKLPGCRLPRQRSLLARVCRTAATIAAMTATADTTVATTIAAATATMTAGTMTTGTGATDPSPLNNLFLLHPHPVQHLCTRVLVCLLSVLVSVFTLRFQMNLDTSSKPRAAGKQRRDGRTHEVRSRRKDWDV